MLACDGFGGRCTASRSSPSDSELFNSGCLGKGWIAVLEGVAECERTELENEDDGHLLGLARFGGPK